eukprot:6200173-Pleurochrysis_carterae.AAC.3
MEGTPFWVHTLTCRHQGATRAQDHSWTLSPHACHQESRTLRTQCGSITQGCAAAHRRRGTSHTRCCVGRHPAAAANVDKYQCTTHGLLSGATEESKANHFNNRGGEKHAKAQTEVCTDAFVPLRPLDEKKG